MRGIDLSGPADIFKSRCLNEAEEILSDCRRLLFAAFGMWPWRRRYQPQPWKNGTKQPFIQRVLQSLYKHLDGNFKEFLGLYSSLCRLIIDTFILYHQLIS